MMNVQSGVAEEICSHYLLNGSALLSRNQYINRNVRYPKVYRASGEYLEEEYRMR